MWFINHLGNFLGKIFDNNFQLFDDNDDSDTHENNGSNQKKKKKILSP